MDKSAMPAKSKNKNSVQTVAGKMQTRSYQRWGLSQPDKADGPCLQAQQGDGVHQLNAEERYRECGLNC